MTGARRVGSVLHATAAEARAAQAAAWTEAQFQDQVLTIAKRLGWRAYHTHDSRRSQPGFPDLTLAHPRHGVLFRELKREKGGRVSPAQRDWLEALTQAGADADIWRPRDLLTGRIHNELQGKEHHGETH